MILNEGIIRSGDYMDWKAQIIDDTKGQTGGYYLLLQHGNTEFFDYWFEKKNILIISLLSLIFNGRVTNFRPR